MRAAIRTNVMNCMDVSTQQGLCGYICVFREQREERSNFHDTNTLRKQVRIMWNVCEILRMLVSEFAHVYFHY